MTTTSRNFVVLDHLRWIAAALVALGHIRSFWLSDYSGGGTLAGVFYFVTGFGHQAVMVFFVLSGFLVGRIVRAEARKTRPDVTAYMIDRASRIFLVLLPALSVAAAAAWFVQHLQPAAIVASGRWGHVLQEPLSDDASPWRWLAAATLTNGIVAPTLESDGPLWSLSFEWTYYVLAIAAACIWRRQWSWVLPYAALLVVLAGALDPGLLISGGVWLMGIVAGWVSDRGWLRGKLLLPLTGGLALAVFLAARRWPVPDFVLGGAISVAIAHSELRRFAWGEVFARRLAAFSYSLYLIHFPIVIVVIAAVGLKHRLPYGATGMAAVAATFIGVCALAALFGGQTEGKTRAVRGWLLRIAGKTPRVPIPASAVGRGSAAPLD